MKQTIRKGDNVRVMRGDKADVDKVGEVIRVLRKEDRVVVQGVNMVKKHQKQQQSGGKTLPSGIMEFEAPVHISNVVLVTDAGEKETKANVGKRTPAAKATVTKKATVAKKATAKAEKKETAKPEAKKPAAKKPVATKTAAAKKSETTKPAAAKKTTATKPAAAKKSTATKPATAKKPAAAKAPAVKKPATKKTADK